MDIKKLLVCLKLKGIFFQIMAILDLHLKFPGCDILSLDFTRSTGKKNIHHPKNPWLDIFRRGVLGSSKSPLDLRGSGFLGHSRKRSYWPGNESISRKIIDSKVPNGMGYVSIKGSFFSPFQMGISIFHSWRKNHGEKHPNQPRISCPGMIFQVGRRPKPLTSPAAQGEHPASLPRAGELELPPPTCDGKHPMPFRSRWHAKGPTTGKREGGGKHTKPDVFKKTCVLLFLSCSCTSCVCSLFFWTCWIDFISSLLHLMSIRYIESKKERPCFGSHGNEFWDIQ